MINHDPSVRLWHFDALRGVAKSPYSVGATKGAGYIGAGRVELILETANEGLVPWQSAR